MATVTTVYVVPVFGGNEYYTNLNIPSSAHEYATHVITPKTGWFYMDNWFNQQEQEHIRSLFN